MRRRIFNTRPLVLLSLAGVLGFAPRVLAHPKPGAHADVRITVTPSGVRVDLLMNLMFVDGLVQTSRQSQDAIAPDEEARVQAALRQYFGSTPGEASGLSRGSLGERVFLIDRPNIVRIDGLVVAPLEREFAIVQPSLETRAGFEQNPLMLLPQVHLTIEYPCKAAPARVELIWGTFPLDFLAQERDTPPPTPIEAILVAQGGVQQILLTQQEPAYIWHNPGAKPLPRPPAPASARATASTTLPVYSTVLIAGWLAACGCTILRQRRSPRLGLAMALPILGGAWALAPYGRLSLEPEPPATTDAEAVAIFRTLHSNVYRAFDYTTESEIYDALAQSVDGQLLDTLYSQVYMSLIMFEEGGAVSRVKELDAVEDRVVPQTVPLSGTFRVRSRWRVEGIVYHWGHSHTRLNEYLAEYDVTATPHGWRIVGITPLEQFRLDPGAATEPQAPRSIDAWRPNR